MCVATAENLFAQKRENLKKVQSEIEAVKPALSKTLIVEAPQYGTPQGKAVDATRHFGEDRGFGK